MMTEMTWSQPSFLPDGTPEPSGVEPANIYDALEAQNSEALPAVDDPKAIFSHVVDITRARAVAKAEKLKQDQLAAAAENQETIGALVDLLAEVDYPGAEIAQAVVGRPQKEMNKSRSQYEYVKTQVCDVALWPIGKATDSQSGRSIWCFGPDKNLYRYDSIGLWSADGRTRESLSRVYVPVDPENWLYLTQHAFNIRDALYAFLNAFEPQAEDDLLQ